MAYYIGQGAATESSDDPQGIDWLYYPGALLGNQQTFTGGDPVGSNALAIKQKVLDKIASGEAARYNELYGGGSFSSFADHPGIVLHTPNGAPTTAAGRYQFTKGTWQQEKNALGLKDFSPESQDAAAWDLAQRTYRQATGRSIMNDAEKGDVDWSALGSQWTSLAKAKTGGLPDTSHQTPDTSPQSTASGSDRTVSNSSADSGTDNRLQRGMMAMMLMQLLAPKFKFTPVQYDPFKVAPKMDQEGNLI